MVMVVGKDRLDAERVFLSTDSQCSNFQVQADNECSLTVLRFVRKDLSGGFPFFCRV